jgi:hypothetical protein
MGFAPQPKPLQPSSDEMSNYLKACAEGRVAAVEVFLKNWPMQTEVHWTESKMTGLLCAAKSGQLEIVKLLVSRGAQLHAADKEGVNALMYAAQSGSETLAAYLLEKGFRAGAKDSQGRCVMHHYVSGGDDDKQSAIPAMLVKHGAEVNAASPAGMKPLQWALSLGRKHIFRALLDLGADIADPMLEAFASQMDTPDFIDMLKQEPARRAREMEEAISGGTGKTLTIKKPFTVSTTKVEKPQPINIRAPGGTAVAGSLATLARHSGSGRSWTA